VRHFRWIPHTLSLTQKAQRIEISQQLLQTLRIYGDRAWHDIITLDESWFYLSIDHEFIWLPHGEKVREREWHIVQLKKSCWRSCTNPRNLHLMNGLAKRCKFNNNHYTTDILSPLSEWCSAEVQGSKWKLVVHIDNASPHMRKVMTDFVEQNRIR
jgi:hypothetical protein